VFTTRDSHPRKFRTPNGDHIIRFEKPNSFVLTGTPGTGKTSLLTALRNRGELGYDEPARKVLTEQLACDGPALPAKSPMLFIKAMLDQLLDNYLTMPESRTFSDRGIPDLIAYAIRFEVDGGEFRKAAINHRHNINIFLLPPWEEIFVNDELRKMTFEYSTLFHETIVEAYEDLGYNLIVVPKIPIDERANFILESSYVV